MAKRRGKAPKKDGPKEPEGPREDSPYDLAAPLSARVQIEGVVLENCRVTLSNGDEEPEEGGVLKIRIQKFGHGIDREKDSFWVSISFNLDATAGDPSRAQPTFQIEASFLLRYHVASVGDFEDRAFAAFARTNGVFNAWPYWREFVQSMTARMGLTPFVIPVFRLP